MNIHKRNALIKEELFAMKYTMEERGGGSKNEQFFATSRQNDPNQQSSKNFVNQSENYA